MPTNQVKESTSTFVEQWIDNDLQDILTSTILGDNMNQKIIQDKNSLTSFTPSPSLPDLDCLSDQSSPTTCLLLSPTLDTLTLFPELNEVDPLFADVGLPDLQNNMDWVSNNENQKDLSEKVIQDLLWDTFILTDEKSKLKVSIAPSNVPSQPRPKRAYTKRQHSESIIPSSIEPPTKKIAKSDINKEDEETALKRRQNTLAARRSRARKQERMQTLEERVSQLLKENQDLLDQQKQWEIEREELLAKIASLSS